MNRKQICYHTRLCSDNKVKVCGGTFGGSIDQETVERMTRFFTVNVKPSGTPVFVDKEGREVYLYLSVDPRDTEIGKQAIKAWYAERRIKQEQAEKTLKAQEAELEDALNGLSHEEIMRRLARGTDE